MSAEEFWKDDPQLYVSYRTSFINNKKRQIEEEDYKCWLQGLYTHDGNSKLFASFKQFLTNFIAGIFKGNKDTTKIDHYPNKPYLELEKESKKPKQDEVKQNDNYKDYEESLQYFGTLKQRYLENLKKSKKGE